jgi:ectoine hydroxylase
MNAPSPAGTRRPDPYPSRGGRGAHRPRREPVVWGDTASVLAPEQRATYERDGFLQLPSLLDQDATQALAAQADALRAAPTGFAPEEVVREPGSAVVRTVFAVHRRCGDFAALARHPRLLALARAVLGSAVYVHQSRINYKPAFDGAQFQWHSDFETWHAEDGMPAMRALSVSVALTDNTPANGPLLLVPGSHRHFIACAGATPKDHYRQSLRAQRYGTPDRRFLRALARPAGITAITGPAGSAVAFDCNTLHASPGNLSPWPRVNVFLVYNSVENRLGAPYAAPRPRPEFLGAREHGPVL